MELLELINDLTLKQFVYQDPRIPEYLKDDRKPKKKMDSPVYRICLEAICRQTTIESFIEIGVKKGIALERVLAASINLKRILLCDFWSVNNKKLLEKEVVETILEKYTNQHPALEADFVDGSSLLTLSKIDSKFHLIGIDGSHRRDVFRSDLSNALRLVAEDGWIVIDDLVLHEDNKIDQELLTFCNENRDEVEIVYRDITNWPGGAILKPTVSKNRVKSSIANAIVNYITPREYISQSKDPFNKEEVIELLDFYIETQDWQATDIIIAIIGYSPDCAYIEPLIRLLKRESLEIDNHLALDILKYLIDKEGLDRSIIPTHEIINGLSWTA